jgi:hypothetical protein
MKSKLQKLLEAKERAHDRWDKSWKRADDTAKFAFYHSPIRRRFERAVKAYERELRKDKAWLRFHGSNT